MEHNIAIKSYAQLVKALSKISAVNVKDTLNILEKVGFADDAEVQYQSKPMQLLYKQLPVIETGEVLVKIVVLRQADNYVITVPENILDTYNLLIEEPEGLSDINTQFSLYAEVYGFNANDTELNDLIKKTYLSAGNSLPAFELLPSLEKKAKDDEEATGSNDELSDFDSDDLADFNEIDEPIETDVEMTVNTEAYKSFKKQTNALALLLENLKQTQPRAVRESLRAKYVDNVLVIESANKELYKRLEAYPKLAKTLLSNLGESIKKFKYTQLVDTFKIDGRSYFVVAESVANNYWIVENEEVDILTESKYVKPLNKNIIKLNKSSVRINARKQQPRKITSGDIVYVQGE